MSQIRNVKISVKIENYSLDNAIKVLKEKNILFHKFNNFVSFKYRFTFVLFKKGKVRLNHLNITNIKKLRHIKKAVKLVKHLFNCDIYSVKVDNIIATYNTLQRINLKSIIRRRIFNKTKYNAETFPGLFIKFEQGTVILFHSGKSVILGCKNKEDLKCIVQQLIANI